MLSGLRVLLAEDNPTNQLVATQMLESLGATAAVAAVNQISVPTAEAGAIAGKGEPAEIEVEAAQVARADGELGVEGVPTNDPTGAVAGDVTIAADSLASTALARLAISSRANTQCGRWQI